MSIDMLSMLLSGLNISSIPMTIVELDKFFVINMFLPGVNKSSIEIVPSTSTINVNCIRLNYYDDYDPLKSKSKSKLTPKDTDSSSSSSSVTDSSSSSVTDSSSSSVTDSSSSVTDSSSSVTDSSSSVTDSSSGCGNPFCESKKSIDDKTPYYYSDINFNKLNRAIAVHPRMNPFAIHTKSFENGILIFVVEKHTIQQKITLD